MPKTKKSITEKLAEAYANKKENEKKLILSFDMYLEYIKWDCKNLCLYYPDAKNPPNIMGLKVILKNGKNIVKIV